MEAESPTACEKLLADPHPSRGRLGTFTSCRVFCTRWSQAGRLAPFGAYFHCQWFRPLRSPGMDKILPVLGAASLEVLLRHPSFVLGAKARTRVLCSLRPSGRFEWSPWDRLTERSFVPCAPWWRGTLSFVLPRLLLLVVADVGPRIS